ncbi:YafY family protein [Balneolaceae bacterium ANBcel3]|nr:YafY family protein [Balneolaceae bacterium ANBcel3]
MNSVVRRLKLIHLLQSGRSFHVSDLVERFSISKRTVYRDINLIQELGIPVVHDPGLGYCILRDGLVPPIMFTFKELSVIAMGLSFIKAQVDDEMKKSAEEVYLKLVNAIPLKLQRQMHLLNDSVLVSPFSDNIEQREASGDWSIICESIVQNKPVRFTYKDKKSKRSFRIIEPLLLIHYKTHWNVIGFCHHRRDLRNFILSKIRDLTIVTNLDRISKPYTNKDLIYRGLKDGYLVKAKVDKTVLFQFLSELPGLIKYREDKGHYEVIHFYIDNLEYINTWFLQFSDNATPLSPLSLLGMRSDLLARLKDDNHRQIDHTKSTE